MERVGRRETRYAARGLQIVHVKDGQVRKVLRLMKRGKNDRREVGNPYRLSLLSRASEPWFASKRGIAMTASGNSARPPAPAHHSSIALPRARYRLDHKGFSQFLARSV